MRRENETKSEASSCEDNFLITHKSVDEILGGKIQSSTNTSEETGKLLKAARLDKLNGYSLNDVVRITGLSKSYVSEIENGSTCSLEVIDKLCEAYSILPEMVLFKRYPLIVLKNQTNKGLRAKLKSLYTKFVTGAEEQISSTPSKV